ncbi:MAG TPA: ABC transporter ATP-binding protein [Acidimicrobiales bacterium]|nr:ABC transporter ATP-binding protein [Acidimicrobiales bacterium]
MPGPLPRPDARATRLLVGALRPEAPALAGVLAVLGVAMALRLVLPPLLGRFADEALGGASTSALTGLAVAYVAAALVAAGLDLAVVWRSTAVSWRAGNRLRQQLLAHALRLEQAWHGRHSPGELIERIDGDVSAMATFFAGMAVRIAGNAALVGGMLVIAFVIDPWTGLVLAMTAVAGTTVMVRLRAAGVAAREHEREVNAQLYGDLEERLGGLEDLRANGAGRYAVHRLHVHSARSWRAARRASWRGDGAYAASGAVLALGTAATLATGIVLHQRGVVTVGTVLALYRYADMLQRPLAEIAEQLKELQKALAGAQRAAGLLATAPAIADGPEDGASLPAGPLAVDLDHVTFAYQPGGAPVLRDVDLHLAPGTHLGLVGRTGSGKSTVGRLLARFRDVPPSGGTVRVGGTDVRSLALGALRARVAVVTQDVELFRATVRDNLTLFGQRAAGDDELRRALDQVGLGPWLASLPGGLGTRLDGTHGLSAGEGQLLALARAFLTRPAVVVLDEASSRLDPATERRLTVATERLLAGRTAVVIAHRLATLDSVDEIAVLEDGRLVEHGPRAALAADPSSRYARLRRSDQRPPAAPPHRGEPPRRGVTAEVTAPVAPAEVTAPVAPEPSGVGE